ncbi:MAG: bifunctional phosphopantothenoylcysteine decarboxylase/phosphopantothenate--cysteine ligase CoaBC [Acidobacteriota bacterium]
MSATARLVQLGVGGGIAAYKAVEVLRGFQRAGHEVRCTLTQNAARFVGPLTFEAISGATVPVGGLGSPNDAAMDHVEQGREAGLFVVAPATANLLGKLANGIADDWLTSHFLANDAPVLLAPAMNQRMWAHPAVQANLAKLVERGASVVQPESGELACGEVGPGRLADPETIVAAGLELLSCSDAWSGRRVLVTSGPTHEDLDAVRFIGNRSSGKMGAALAAEARSRGAEVVVVSGPATTSPPSGVRVVSVRTAAEMADAVATELPEADVVFFAAAVADFTPVEVAEQKIRREDRDELVLTLGRTRDVLGESVAAKTSACLVGFAAETVEDAELAAAGRAKLERKGCDLLYANVVGGERSAFDADEAAAVVVGPDGYERRLERASKRRLAAGLLDVVDETLKSREGKT